MTAITSDSQSAMRAAHNQGQRIGSTGNRAIPVRNLSDWQVKAVQKLASLGTLRQNWDSYGSPVISDEVLDCAFDLVCNLSLESVPTFRITPVSGGGIQLEWEKGDRALEIELHPDLTYDLQVSIDDEPADGMVTKTLDRAMVEGLLSWLKAG